QGPGHQLGLIGVLIASDHDTCISVGSSLGVDNLIPSKSTVFDLVAEVLPKVGSGKIDSPITISG
ncbi:MAG: hypothetical protein AAGD22_15795, partial [Verrucomicrobiota bacterium]